MQIAETSALGESIYLDLSYSSKKIIKRIKTLLFLYVLLIKNRN